MRLLICGDRHWYDYALVKQEVEEFRLNVDMIECIIEGGAHGADFCGKMVAVELGIPVEEYPADWEHLRMKAGPVRNQRMLEKGKPDFILAFHDDIDNSKGTRNMLKLAERAGVPFAVVKHDYPWQPDVTVFPEPQIPGALPPPNPVPYGPYRPKPASPPPYEPWDEMPKPKGPYVGRPWSDLPKKKFYHSTHGVPVTEELPAIFKPDLPTEYHG